MEQAVLYASEKLASAVRSMTVGPGDVRQRLADAYMIFHTVRADDLPEGLRSDWEWVLQQLTRFGPVYDRDGKQFKGAVSHTLEKIRRPTGVKIAERVLFIHRGLESWIKEHGEF
jgi:membrane-bound lytic murein transglycosylase B